MFKSRLSHSALQLATIALVLQGCNVNGNTPKAVVEDGSVDETKIRDNSVLTRHIRAGQIGTSKLADGSVTLAKLDPALNFSTTGTGTFTGGLTVGGAISGSSTLAITGATTLSERLTVARSSTTSGAIGTVSGILNTFTLTPAADITSGTALGLNSTLDYQGTASANNAGTTLLVGGATEFDHNGSGTLESVVGLRGTLDNKSTGTLTVGTGLQARAYNTSSGTAVTLRGIFADTKATGSGAITNASALDATLTNTGTGVITNGFGIRISNTGANAITTNYVGLLINDPGRTANTTATYGVYSDGSTFNYFAGRVGIGNASPTVALDVTGAAQVTGAVTLTGIAATSNAGTNPICIDNATGVVTRSVNGAGCNTTSDRRLKDRIETIQGALEKVLSLTGVTYFWKDKTRGTAKHVGLVAQDVEKAFPELVSKDSKGFLGVDYQGLVGPLVQAVKELHAKWSADHKALGDQGLQIGRLEKKIELENLALKAENKALKDRLDRLETALAQAAPSQAISKKGRKLATK